ncbi:MAG: glycogen synthase [Clostridia bacterium]|nr:glycogen synthase [Clostridia bacterium]
MKILYVASEVVPYAKSGGLADVAGSLPKELIKLGHDTSIIMPRYKMITQDLTYVLDFPINMNGRTETCIIRKHEQEIGNGKKLTTYFVDNAYYFDRDGMYCHPDEAERFAFFDKAVAEFSNRILKPDVLHLNDWQTGPIALLTRDRYNNKHVKIIYTIHNLEYNGRFNSGNLYHFDLDWSYFTPEKLEFFGDFSFTKAGLLYSDIITTVSKTYAQEIQTEKYGFGYEGILRYKSEDKKLFGIVNGIDYQEFNPAIDDEIYTNFDVTTLNKKKINKQKLQEELGLPVKDVPILSIISRIVQHKGVDILVESMNEILKQDVQFIVLGVGEQHYINRFKMLKERYEDKIIVKDIFDPVLAKKIYAGSDIFMMPSMFEPCGLSQLISFRYGTIPVARRTGGLNDTVVGYLGNKEEGNGFTFWGTRTEDLIEVTNKAIQTYSDKDTWTSLVERAMTQDYSWAHSAKEYIKLYEM